MRSAKSSSKTMPSNRWMRCMTSSWRERSTSNAIENSSNPSLPSLISSSHPDMETVSDIFPTGYMAADFCNLKGGETVAIWGCGPVGQFAVRSAFLLGAERGIAIGTVAERLQLAKDAGAITLDFRQEDIYDRIQELTGGRGADACIDAVGTEPDTRSGFDAVLDRVKVATFMGTDRPP